MADQDFDRSESATLYKLQKARERGQVGKSPDLTSAGVLCAAVIFLTWQGREAVHALFRLAQITLFQVSQINEDGSKHWVIVSQVVRALVVICVPFFVTIILVGILANILQTGPIFSLEPIKPDFDRINPANGFKKLFSLRSLFDGARACVKLLLLLLVAYYALKSLVPQFYRVAEQSPLAFVRTLIESLSSLGFKMVLILGLIALVDMLFTQREFAKKMRMSKREVKDEAKHREGDPRIRARLRELRREWLKRSRSLRNTSKADVLLTNPTHVAVALRYEHGKMESPQLIAKGSGYLAAAMREIAIHHNIPIVQNPRLARKLFRELDVEHHVPQSLYADVARIIVWVFAMRERRQRATMRRT